MKVCKVELLGNHAQAIDVFYDECLARSTHFFSPPKSWPLFKEKNTIKYSKVSSNKLP